MSEDTEATPEAAPEAAPTVEAALQHAAEVGQGNPQPAETTFAALAAARTPQPDDYMAAEPLRMDNVEYAVGDYIPAEAFAKNGALKELLKIGVVKFRYQLAPPEDIRAEAQAQLDEIERLKALLKEQGIDADKL